MSEQVFCDGCAMWGRCQKHEREAGGVVECGACQNAVDSETGVGHRYDCLARALRPVPKLERIALPTDAAERKATPVFSGVLAYFPDALCEVARVSKAGNDQHNPGQPLHWAKEKSTDEADALVRHLLERGKRDSDGMRHSAKVAWRALAMLQRELEAEK